MSRNLQLYLADIVVACEKVLRYTNSMEFEQFIADDRTFDAVIRNLLIIGEAVKNVPVDVRDRNPEIEWRKIAGLRDILAHTYFQIENEIIWDVVKNKINPLLIKVSQLLESQEDNDRHK
ncbi:MAG: DUF86 domain-containing protein [Desmonostoc geniculatum HA4340-LM1]|jgi:uncharacterized protein with HEPN domain|nr:DUF86 domain-containing protein [Desmonostoc geniculatum HA4340-LM1]